MKILTMGSPASTDIFDQKINKIYNGNYEVQKVKEFYTLGHLLSSYTKVKRFAETVKQNSKLYDFLTWNFEKEGFWGKLDTFQPDLLVLDLFPEVYFGSFILEDETCITRNFRLMDSIPKNATPFNTSCENYVQKVMEQVKAFEERVHVVTPKTKILFNGARFPQHMSQNGKIQKKFDGSIYKLPANKINGYNRNWEILDQALVKEGFDVLNFDQKNSATELNFPTGEHWYYFYNQNYYTDVQCQIEAVAQHYNLGPTILKLNVGSDVDVSKITQDVVLLNVPNPKNDLKIFRKDKFARKLALELAGKDYVLHGNKGHYYRFVKRRQLKTEYPKFKDVHYRIIPPKEEKKFWGNKLLVRMPAFTRHYKTSMMERNFQVDFISLKDSVVKDTYILEIGDINLMAGSFYTNTKNYPDYEKQVQDLIQAVAKKFNVGKNDIVLYGASRGGVGAVLHAALGNYKFIASDPVIDDTTWYLDSDIHFVEGVRDIDLTDKVSTALSNYQRSKGDGIILGTSNIGVTFSAHLRLPLSKVTLLDLDIDLHRHPGFNKKTTSVQLSIINYLLIKDDFKMIEHSDQVSGGVVLEVKHLAQNAINLQKVDKFRIKLSDIKKYDRGVTELAMDNIKDNYKYVRTDDEFEYFELI
ncbi:XcbB/CpsF family capsular polysaccharide biosynthesis protein [Ligilactobacillus acidipiscis]|nr:XcbB/CpsF family capsular polysaccharide biosynthesis protein [Ligilactobacillus acidipiscis]